MRRRNRAKAAGVTFCDPCGSVCDKRCRVEGIRRATGDKIARAGGWRLV